jgi:hypothetical protein
MKNDIYILQEQSKECQRLNKLFSKFGLNSSEFELSKNLFANERKLQNKTQELRHLWLEEVGNVTSRFNRSSWEGEKPIDLFEKKVSFTYETLTNDTDVAAHYEYKIEGFRNGTFLYPNGMQAIKGTLEAVQALSVEEFVIEYSAAYFETQLLFRIMESNGVNISKIHNGPNHANVFYFEPMMYDFDANLVDMDGFIQSVMESTAEMVFIIVDSTMHGQTHLVERLNNRLNNKVVIFIDVRSGLKLDQEGLELSNLGVAEWFVRNNYNHFYKESMSFIRKYKGLCGANISYAAITALSCGHDTDESKKYSENVKRTAIDFIEKIRAQFSGKGEIKSVYLPQGTLMGEKLVCPFIYLKLRCNTTEQHVNFIHEIQSTLRHDNLFLPFRNSWGFRFPSIECIEHFESKENIIKLYTGTYEGLVWHRLIEIILSIDSRTWKDDGTHEQC